MKRRTLTAAIAMALVTSLPAVAQAACGNNGAGFPSWLAGYQKQVAGQGLSGPAVSAALQEASYDPGVIRLDRGQKSFKLSFEQFYARRVSSSLINRGRQRMQQNAGLFSSIEKRFGVPAPILVAIWGLETNYGADGNGGKSIIRSLATLAYDCRRSEFFTNELTNALRIVQRGDMPVSQLRGGWAGEIGPMQFLPSSYVKYAVDFDGDGRRDLMRSTADMLASTANYLKSKGWKAGQGWGPGTANHEVIREWNKADVYVRTISTMATKLSGGGA